MNPFPPRPRLRRGLYLVLTEPPRGYERMAEWAVAAGLPALQLRPKPSPPRPAPDIATDRDFLRVARALRAITRGSPTLLLIDDRPDLALLCEADGLHVGQDDLPPADARRLIGPRPLLGLSTHTLAQVRAAAIRALADAPDPARAMASLQHRLSPPL